MKKTILISLIIFSAEAFAQGTQWRFANGPYEGEVHKLAINPSQPNIVYAAAVGTVVGKSGLYKSTDGGKTWRDIGPDIEVGALESTVAIDPINSSNICFGSEWGGILNKSTDGGMTWQKKYLLKDSVHREIRSIAINPLTPDVIYVGLNYELNNVIWKSTDAGETWKVKTSGIPKRDSTRGRQRTAAIEINPLNPSVLFADASLDGLFRSDDGAENWRYVGFKGFFVNDIEILPWDTATVLVGTWAGLFKSTDGGETWRKMLMYNTRSIKADSNTKTFYAGTQGNGVFKSIDNGKIWIPINNPELPTSMSMAMDVFDLAIDPQDGDNLHLGTAIGPYKSSDGGNNWQQSCDGMKNFYAYNIKISPSNPSVIYATGLHGIHRSENHGETWKYIGGRGVFNGIAVDPVDFDIVYASLVGLDITNYLYRTTNGGQTWTIVSTIHSATFIPFIEIDRSPQRAVYISTYDQFLRSFDYGTTWQVVQAPIIPGSLAIANDNADLLYVGSRDGVYKSTNKGQTWDSLSFSNFGENIALFVDPKNSQTVYARVYGHGLYKSTDGGKLWFEKNNGLPSKNYIAPSLINPQNPTEIFVATDSGLYQTTNSGDEWHLMEPPPPSSVVFTLAIDTSYGERLLTGSNRLPGVYILDVITSVGENRYQTLLGSFWLSQNYPNPFNSGTIIRYSINANSRVSLKIFDVLGREFKSLINSEQTSGEYSVQFDATGLPSGIYFYQLQINGQVITKKMILLR